ncbi:MAG: DUF4169 family protein [Stellaceae bacterium]
MTIINLNKYRKQRRQMEREREAAENRLRFGRNNRERAVDLKDRERLKNELDSKRLD